MRNQSKKAAFTLVELLVVIAIIAGIVAVQVPALAKTKSQSRRIKCVNNLKQVGMAFRKWSGDNGGRYPMQLTSAQGGPTMITAGTTLASSSYVNQPVMYRAFMVMSNELTNPNVLVCPEDTYHFAATNWSERTAAMPNGAFSQTSTSYFLGAQADETKQQMLLSGDWDWVPDVAVQNTVFLVTPFGTNTSVSPLLTAGWSERMHSQNGNVLHVGGNVQQLSTNKMKEAFRDSGDGNNILLFPF